MNDKIVKKLLELATKLKETAEKLQPEKWVPPREMIAEVTNHDHGEWFVRRVKAGTSFDYEELYSASDDIKWRHCRPLQDPFVYQFRPHTPGDPPPNFLAPNTKVVVIARNGKIGIGEGIKLYWDSNLDQPMYDIIGWLPLGERY